MGTLRMATALGLLLPFLAARSSSSSSGTAADASATSDGAGGVSDDASVTSEGGEDASATFDAGTCDPTTATQVIVAAANAFLATFDSSQDAGVQFPFTRPAYASLYSGNGGRLGEQYGSALWSNYPASDVPRPGVPRGLMTSAQQAAEDALLQVALSAEGYAKIQQIMGGDQAQCDEGQQFTCGTAVYTIGIFGAPSTSAPWMIEFGAHHIGLNVVIDRAQGTVAPTLTGAQPAVYQAADGGTVRSLAAENDNVFALIASLDSTQSAQAIASYTVSDLVLGPGKFVAGSTVPVPEGVRASSFTAAQKTLLMNVITEWAGIINSAYTCTRLADIESGLNDTYFLWSGPTTHDPDQNGSSYFRIQGPKLWIEFSPQGDTAGCGMGGGDGGGGMGGGPVAVGSADRATPGAVLEASVVGAAAPQQMAGGQPVPVHRPTCTRSTAT